MQSDWSRNDLHGQVKAGYSDYFEAPEASGPYGAGNLDVGVSQRDATTTFGLKGEYRVNRDVVLRATATRQQFVSNVANSNYVSNVFMLGVRLQR